jgi:hypothetical protein
MFHKLFTNITRGVSRGVMISFLTCLLFPVVLQGISVLSELITQNKIYLVFLDHPEALITTSVVVFVFYAFPSILIGVSLEFLFPKKTISRVVFALISATSSYFVWDYLAVVFKSSLYATEFVLMIVFFHYLYFFNWRRPND